MATKFGGRTVSDKANAPGGPTFTPAPAKLAGPTNTKRKANFGIECSQPHGITFPDPCKAAFDDPDAPAPMKGSTKNTPDHYKHSFDAVGTMSK
jgi:hypothetical protein